MPELTESAIRAEIIAEAEKVGSRNKLAAEWGISPAYLGLCLHGHKLTKSVLGPLGIEREVTVRYVRRKSKGVGKRRK